MPEFDSVSQEMDKASFEELEPKIWARHDVIYQNWCAALLSLADAPATVREALPTAADARRMRDIQLACVPITPMPLRDNAATISGHRVLIAEIERVHVGFVLASLGPEPSPLFVQVVAVVSEAQRRGIGQQLLSAAAALEPQRNIVLATQETNLAAHALNKRFADSMAASIHKVNLGVYPNKYLGIRRGQGYRVWEIERG
ncbi:GNAT family N-acetyltransferase [Arthrobacter agilis]|uniref:GNAT family N-acetyltransferase n=1 Tax=Arthrobacter agilis TaxID=37921 RepID=UPI00236565BD|nr:GNAT family N-acetyltransferase [Arthrobacter agilis]WDF33724.1 GNAT family N-acetyltransferase [Arthrobacter agilis]